MHEFIGLLPAAGQGSRLALIPTSKEIMPLGFEHYEHDGLTSWRTITPIEEHLWALKQAGVTRCVVVVSTLKPDIMRYLGNGERFGLSIAYLVTPTQNPRPFHGMPFSLDLARAWVNNATTLFAMPDTIIVPRATMRHLVQHHMSQSADLTLGLFRTTTPSKFGMVALNEQGHPISFVDKPMTTELELMWGLAAWSPRFGAFLHTFLSTVEYQPGTEIVLSDVFAAAIQHLSVHACVFKDAHYYDIGTPADFQTLILDLAKRPSF